MNGRSEPTIRLETLRRRIARLETGGHRVRAAIVSSGFPVLDQLLPERGFRCGSLVEWIAPADGAGAWTLAMSAAREAGRRERAVVVFDRRREFCPTAAVRLGIEPERLIVVHADTAIDQDWAIDQALRSSAVAAAVAWPQRLDDRTFRRWQLAAEEGGCLGLLVRPASACGEPSWADVRLLVEPLPSAPESCLGGGRRRLRITVLRCRGGDADRVLNVELDDETHRLHPLEDGRPRLAR